MAGKREIERSTGATRSRNGKNYGRRSVNQKKGRWKRHLVRTVIIIFVLVGLYLTAVFSNIPFIAKWRTIYIETAMSTKTHQWLATYFIPKSVIDQVMADVEADLNSQVGLSSLWDEEDIVESETVRPTETAEVSPSESPKDTISDADSATNSAETAFFEKYWELDTTSFREYIERNPDAIADGYDHLVIDNFDGDLNIDTTNGDEIYALDAENNVLIVNVSGSNFQGKLAITKNAAQVDLVKSTSLGSCGQQLATLAENNDAVIAINCSGFGDAEGHGNGGLVIGSLIIDGVEYGYPETGTWKLFGFKDDNRLYIMDYSSSEAKSFRWAAQFFPALILDGKSVVDGTFGMGLQPRACIGQTRNGDFLMLIVDGRQVGYSVGCTVADCTDILLDYHAYQAMNLDGGSSAIMLYKGERITSPSSVSSEGRYLPDALIIRYASNTVD